MAVDPRDLLDSTEVAELIGLGNPNGVSVYRRRYPDFPGPIIEKGRCVLWERSAIVEWYALRGSR